MATGCSSGRGWAMSKAVGAAYFEIKRLAVFVTAHGLVQIVVRDDLRLPRQSIELTLAELMAVSTNVGEISLAMVTKRKPDPEMEDAESPGGPP